MPLHAEIHQITVPYCPQNALHVSRAFDKSSYLSVPPLSSSWKEHLPVVPA